jgi:hypothetical protein
MIVSRRTHNSAEIRYLGVIRWDRVKTLEVLKSRVNPDRSSKGTRVGRLACLGIRHSRETKCVKEKTPKVPKYGVNLDHS